MCFRNGDKAREAQQLSGMQQAIVIIVCILVLYAVIVYKFF